MEKRNETAGPSGEILRLFVALLPTEPVRREISRLADGAEAVRWLPVEQYHLTLRFIGEVGAGLLPEMESALERVRVKPFLLDVGGVGGFPPRGHPSILWAGLSRGHPLLHQLRQQVDDYLLATSVPFEIRSFVPHITIGRCRDAPPVQVAHWLKKHRAFVGPAWPVDAFHLMVSERSGGALSYRSLRRFELEPASGFGGG